jgi:hypothetical protein
MASQPAAAPAKPVEPQPPVQQTPLVETVTAEEQPFTERINIGGLVIEKTVHDNGVCETEVLREPLIPLEFVRATRAQQRQAGWA